MDRAFELWGSSLWPLLKATLTATIPLSIVCFAIALVLGTLVALARFSRLPILAQLCAIYVWIFRGTPLLVQLFIVFYGLPKVGLTMDAWTAAIITLSLNTGAYASEAIRAAISSIPKGQWEAAATLNLSRWQTFSKVIAPQTIRIALPPLGNDFIDLVKGTSLTASITLVEVFLVGQRIAAATFEPLILYLEVAAIYLVINTLLTWLQAQLEHKFSRYVKR
mgnify:CR=1 FL=1